VATALGVLLALSPYLALGTLATWITIAVFSVIRHCSADLGGVRGIFRSDIVQCGASVFIAVAVLAALLIWRHQSNIRNLLAGKESKLGARPRVRPGAGWRDPSVAAR